MYVSRNLTAILLGTLLTLTATGCADTTNLTAPRHDVPVGPSFDGIGTAGSGNRNDSTGVVTQSAGVGTAGSGNLSQADSLATTIEVAGIGTAGSGN